MAKSSIKITIPKMSVQFKHIGKANHEQAYKRIVSSAAKAIEDKVKAELAKATINDEDGDIARSMMPIEVRNEQGAYVTEVGWKVGTYPKDTPASPGWKAIFVNYGTPNQDADGFMDRVRKDKTKIVNKAIKEEMSKILKEELG